MIGTAEERSSGSARLGILRRGGPFRDRENTSRKKEVFQGELADTGVIMKAFQTVKEFLGRKAAFQREVCEDVPDKEGVHKRSRGWKDESFN